MTTFTNILFSAIIDIRPWSVSGRKCHVWQHYTVDIFYSVQLFGTHHRYIVTVRQCLITLTAVTTSTTLFSLSSISQISSKPLTQPGIITFSWWLKKRFTMWFNILQRHTMSALHFYFTLWHNIFKNSTWQICLHAIYGRLIYQIRRHQKTHALY